MGSLILLGAFCGAQAEPVIEGERPALIHGPWERAGHRAPVHAVAVSADGGRAVSVDRRGTILVWDLRAKAHLWPGFTVGDNWVPTTVALTPAGRRLIGCDGHLVYAIDLTGDRPRSAQLGSGNSFGLLPGSNRLAIGQPTGKVRLLDLTGEIPEKTIELGVPAPRGITLSPDGRWVAAMHGLGDVVVHDTRRRQTFPGPDHEKIYSVSFSPDGSRLIAATFPSGIVTWDIDNRRDVASHDDSPLTMHAARFTPDGQTLLAARRGGVILRDVTTGVETGRFGTALDAIEDMAISADGSTLVIGGSDEDSLGTVNVLSLKPANPLVAIQPGEPFDEERLERLWQALDSEHPVVAESAMTTLALRPAQAVALVRSKLGTPEDVKRWIDDLASRDRKVREKAEARLLEQGKLAAVWVRAAKPNAKSLDHELRLVLLEIDLSAGELRGPLRWRRVCRLLDWIDTEEARELRERFED